MIEICCLIVVGLVTWMIAAEGIVGAGQIFLITLLSGLIAMNFFEPLAAQLTFLPDSYRDFVALIGLFTILVFCMRMGAEQMAPSYIQVIPTVDSIGKWAFGAATGYLTMAILLTSLHTAPLPRDFWGFKPERNNFMGVAPDRQWLGFVQYVSEKPLARTVRYKIGSKDVYGARAFDGRFEVVGDPNRPYSIRNHTGAEVPQVIWASFPIRYASRRDQINLGSAAAPPPAPIALPQAAPGPGGGGQPANPGF